MATFSYQAIEGSGQTVVGEIEADNVRLAIAMLEERGLAVQSIGLASSVSFEGLPTSARRTARQTNADGRNLEQTVLQAHMATILERGQAIVPALRAYAEEMPAGRQRKELLEVCRVLASGNAADAIAALANLPEYWIPMLSAATLSTDAGRVLQEFLTESRQADDLRHQWWLTLAYPIVLLSLATIVMLGLSTFIIPEFAKVFVDFDLELPGLTQLIVVLARFMASFTGLIVCAVVVALLVVMLNAGRLLPASTFAWLGDRIRLPFGRRATLARFSRFLADLLEAGVSLPDSLRIAGYCVNRLRLRRAAWNLANEIETVEGPIRPVGEPQLSATVSHVLLTDMSTPSRIRMLREISQCHAERVRTGLSWTSGLVEPFAICLVGFVVGIVVLGLYLPLLKLIEGLSG